MTTLTAPKIILVQMVLDGGIREFFEKAEEVFFEEYLAAYRDHVERVWRKDEKILIFLLLGNKRLAQLLAQWLYHHHEHRGVVEDAPEFSWPTQSETIQLENHDMTGVPVTVVARDCIQWLLQNADAYKMIDDVLIAEPLQSLVWNMAQADEPVDLFDKTTWDDVDFWPLRRGLVDRIALAFANNQTAENHVQICALVRSTNVGIHRASCRVMSRSLLIQNFNERSVAEKKATIMDKKRKEKVK